MRSLPICMMLAVCSLPLTTGCNGSNRDRVPVSGIVTIDGEPLTYGTIRLLPVGEGRPAFANIDSQGRFDFGERGVRVGLNRVEIMAAEQLGDTGYKWHAPQKYNNVATSGLEENIEKATDNLHIELTWDGAKPATTRTTGGAAPRS